MRDGWAPALWGDVAVLEYGKGLVAGDRSSGGPVRVYGTNGPIGWTAQALGSGPTVIVGRKGAYRGVHFSSGPFWVIDTAFWLRPKVPMDMRWAYYELLTHDINGQDSGSAIPSLSRPDFYALPLKVPTLGEQKAIGQLLGALDDKIDLNRAMNRTIAHVLQAMLAQMWFENPAGFVLKPLAEIADIIDCLHSAKPSRMTTGSGVLLQLNNISDDGTMALEDEYLVSEADYALWTSRIELEPRDCVITNVGRVGAVAQVPDGFQAAPGRNMTAIRSKSILISPTYLLEALLSPEIREEIRVNTDSGTILESLNVRNIGKLRIPTPAADRVPELESKMRPLRALMEANLREQQALRDLRDALLAELISGRMTVN
jgi:type I restriction enzyme, S subunit